MKMSNACYRHEVTCVIFYLYRCDGPTENTTSINVPVFFIKKLQITLEKFTLTTRCAYWIDARHSVRHFVKYKYVDKIYAFNYGTVFVSKIFSNITLCTCIPTSGNDGQHTPEMAVITVFVKVHYAVLLLLEILNIHHELCHRLDGFCL